MSRCLITLTTDFGEGSPYVAQMKGVMLSINPAATLVDITHSVPPQDIRRGALLLDDATRRFPEDTIHVAVVDPGVGTERAIVFARIGNHSFIAPDNGLLSLIATASEPRRLIAVTNPDYWLSPVSPTFHGRDIMSPVAAHLSLGVDPTSFGSPHEKLVLLDWPQVQIQPRRISGAIIDIDSFGNLITNIRSSTLADAIPASTLRIRCNQLEISEIVAAYGDRLPMTPVALIGSSDRLELAVVNGNAARTLGIRLGDQVVVQW